MRVWSPENIKRLRLHMGLSQREFGKRLGGTETSAQSWVSDLERGVSKPGRQTRKLMEIHARQEGFDKWAIFDDE